MPPSNPMAPTAPALNVNDEYLFVPFSVVMVTATIAGNGSSITAVTLDQDADFELHYIQGSSSLDTATSIYNNNFSCQITDKSNSRIWSSDRVPQVLLCGPTNQGIPERRPVVLARKTNLSFDVLNLVANPIIVTMVLKGFKVRPLNA